MVCQITMEVNGCRLIVSSGAYKAVVECLIKLLSEDTGTMEDNGPIFLACDIILNLLLKKEHIRVPLDGSCFIRLLGAMSSWADDAVDWSCIMMASSICSLILDSTSETILQSNPHFNNDNFIGLCRLMKRSLSTFGKHTESEADLHQIVKIRKEELK
ncbi:uncharacterized protein LOC143615272 isoform X2 [Bidens hawaiensis]|uniref:uncharacterized protein LOC143615272 isoform X2 n=1 Tax=Bidens hawaiensis TaxID=980011 RepID=UPI00404903A4